MGVVGAALATIFSQLLSSVCVYCAINRKICANSLAFSEVYKGKMAIADIVDIGVSAGLQSALVSISNIFVMRYINLFNTAAVAGTGVAQRVEKFIILPAKSFGIKPVVLTGSQIPMCEIRSDGGDNLITSLLIAGGGRVHEVCLYFGGKLLRGNRATKYSADGLIAFISPNYPFLAETGITIRYNEAALRQRQQGGLRLQLLENVPIGVLKVFPGIQFEMSESIMTEKLRGIVIETFGTGNIPGDGGALLPIIRKAFQNGTVLTVCSQCPQGAVSLGTYETSSALKKAGAVSGLDMTTEAAVVKLYYLFSLGCGKESVKTMMEQDLRGEITLS